MFCSDRWLSSLLHLQGIATKVSANFRTGFQKQHLRRVPVCVSLSPRRNCHLPIINCLLRRFLALKPAPSPHCRGPCPTLHFFKSTPPVTVCKAPRFLSAQSPGHSIAEKAVSTRGLHFLLPSPTPQKMAEINKEKRKETGLGSERLELSVGLSLEWLPLSRKQSLSFLA